MGTTRVELRINRTGRRTPACAVSRRASSSVAGSITVAAPRATLRRLSEPSNRGIAETIAPASQTPRIRDGVHIAESASMSDGVSGPRGLGPAGIRGVGSGDGRL